MTEQIVQAATLPTLVTDISEWLADRSLAGTSFGELLDGCAKRLHAIGVPVWRVHVSYQTLHPLFQGMGGTWRRDVGLSLAEYEHEEETEDEPDRWISSPLKYMLDHQVFFMRRKLAGEEALVDFPILEELRDDGATEWIGFIVAFDEQIKNGMIGSWATDRPEGFTDAQLQALMFIQKPLSVAIKMAVTEQIAENVAHTYLGRNAGRRVMEGQIRRGDGETIPSAILMSDLRGSTHMAENMDRETYIGTLNDYFAAVGDAVHENKGEVLDFIGDAILAIFPVDEEGETEAEASAQAMAATREAVERITALNVERKETGDPALEFGVGLHLGEVMFGNIGTPDRLTFSVIGSSVNEVARLESLTKELGEPIVASALFADHVAGDWRRLGDYELRGVGEKMTIKAPVRASA